MLVNAKSDIGLVRQTNEDSYACVDPTLYIVADGMGGHVAGEIASNLVVDTVKDFVRQRNMQAETAEQLLKEAIAAANGIIYEKARSHSEYGGMGTTISMVYLLEARCFWAHVGDSRIYLYHENALRQVTQDHSLVWNLVESGTITAEEASTHPQRNMLTRAVGVETSVQIDTGVLDLTAGDKLLLCSDGLTNMLSHSEIEKVLCSMEIERKAEALVAVAIEAGGIDNITAIILEC